MMMKQGRLKITHRTLLIITTAFLALVMSACIPLRDDITPPPGSESSFNPDSQPSRPAPIVVGGFPLVAPNPARGSAIFQNKCAPCHGDLGYGDGPDADDLPNPVAPIGDPAFSREKTPSAWFAQVTNGNIDKYMPPFLSLNDQERWDVVAYAFTLSQNAEALAEIEAVYELECAECHNSESEGPYFTDQERMASLTAIDLFASLAHPGIDGANFEEALPEADRWALTDYVRTISFASPEDEIASDQTDTGVETSNDLAAAPADVEPADVEPPVVESEPNVDEALSPVTPAVGTVTGRLISPAGSPISQEVEVTLIAYDHIQEVFSLSATTDANGEYSFEDIEMSEGRAFIVTTDYNEAVFSSDIAIADPLLPDIDLPIPIFETASDKTLLNIDRLHLFIEQVDQNTLRIGELMIISNASNQVVVPAAEGVPVFNIPLPEGAQNLQIQDGVLGGRFVVTETGFGDTLAIYPGVSQYQLLFSFDMPIESKVEITQPLDLTVSEVVALLPQGSLQFRGDGFNQEGTQDVQGQQYSIYTSMGYEPGSTLSLTISGEPSFSGLLTTSGNASNLLIGGGALLIAVAFGSLWLRRIRMANEDDEEYYDDEPLDSASLMDAIIALDDRYQAGDLPEEGYLRRRDELKSQLQDAIKREGA